ncbi:alpha/beta-hydrolase [Wolfiporia cocos MD-104 SS10]|uniref:Alpha/beta-hydrolase n=1 Tax=Wolfiporia cocos (strain MD-104) TaxID=742152 RepID=A0A2H3JQ69_WOLCO|nr:alpha/beta-hydrolase [Wolfiporia cocos MD-104 SS10]
MIELSSGTRLECDVSLAQSAGHTRGERSHHKLAICLHPWSWLGGRMGDPVLRILMKPLHARGYHVLRYNSRGVGQSSGWTSLTGSREAQDLKDLVQWAINSFPALSSIVILGYSYGSLIASLHPTPSNRDLRISHILLSYPLGPRHWLTAFHSGSYASALRALVRDPQANVLILYGNQDEFTSDDAYGAWAAQLSTDCTGDAGAAGGKLQVVRVEDATHFWRGEDVERRLVDTVEVWLP